MLSLSLEPIDVKQPWNALESLGAKIGSGVFLRASAAIPGALAIEGRVLDAITVNTLAGWLSPRHCLWARHSLSVANFTIRDSVVKMDVFI